MRTEQTIGDYTIVFADNNIEYVYYQGTPINLVDIPDRIFTQIDFAK